MKRGYKNPPIETVVCEFSFEGVKKWDENAPNLIYNRVRGMFPKKMRDVDVEMVVRPGEVRIEEMQTPASVRYQFFRKDDTASVQLDSRTLVVTHGRPYPSWSVFKKMVLDVLSTYVNVASPSGFKAVVVKYVNLVEFYESEINLADYFRFRVVAPGRLPRRWTPVMAVISIPYEEGGEMLVMSSSMVTPEAPASIAFLLDIAYSRNDARCVDLESISEWLDKAHKRIKFAFEASITPKLRKRFY